MKYAAVTGTFDPPTLGHLDIIQRAHKMCNKLIVCVAQNESKVKQITFSVDDRVAMLKEITKDLANTSVVFVDGLISDYAKKNNIHFLVRGLRAFSNIENELRMAQANKKLSGVETVFLLADERYSHISSSLIKEISFHKSSLKDFVPSSIEESVLKRLLNKKK